MVARRSELPKSPDAPRRGRPPVITDEAILDTAREVFLEHGIRATTAEVALRAGISEGTVFHRFKSKDALFRAAMRFDPQEGPAMIALLVPPVGTPDLRGALVTMAHRLLDLGRVVLPVMMMSWSNPSGEYSLEKMIGRKKPSQHLVPLIKLVEAEMAAGRLAPANPQIVVRAFLGGLRDYTMSGLLPIEDPERPEPQAFVEGLIDLLFRAPAASRNP